MGRRGRNRDKRNLIMDQLEVAQPEVYAELLELRSTNPQAYRKQLRYWVQYYPIADSQRVMANRGAKFKGQTIDTMDVLEQPFQILRQAIRAGNFDDRLDDLTALEKAGRDRPVVHLFIQQRRDVIAAPPRPLVFPRETPGGWGQRVDQVEPEPEVRDGVRAGSWRDGEDA